MPADGHEAEQPQQHEVHQRHARPARDRRAPAARDAQPRADRGDPAHVAVADYRQHDHVATAVEQADGEPAQDQRREVRELSADQGPRPRHHHVQHQWLEQHEPHRQLDDRQARDERDGGLLAYQAQCREDEASAASGRRQPSAVPLPR
jgi:hypothetical protein